MRMLEQILAGNDDRYCDSSRLRQCKAEIEIFLIDNVAEYLYAQTDQEVWEVKKDFPCLAPPFPSFWMEYGRPSKIVSCEEGIRSTEDFPYRVGLWFDYCEVKGENFLGEDALRKNMNVLRAALNAEFTPEIDQELKSRIADGADFMDINDGRWNEMSSAAILARSRMLQYGVLSNLVKNGSESMVEVFAKRGITWLGKCFPYLQPRRNGPVIGPLGEWHLGLNGNGDVIESTSALNMKILPDRGSWNRDRGGLSTLWFPGLLAISFCHCKNVTIKSEEAPAKLVKRQAERGRQHITYRLLEIGPIKTVLKKAGAETADTGLKRALHICRGHFANYAENGLFGKYLGRFWIPQHMRGSLESGVALKEYVVKPRQEP